MQRVQNSSIVLCCVVNIYSLFLLEERQMKGKKQIQKPKRRGAFMGNNPHKTTKNPPEQFLEDSANKELKWMNMS